MLKRMETWRCSAGQNEKPMTYSQLLREGSCKETQEDAKLIKLYMTRSTTDERYFFGFVCDCFAVQSQGGAPALFLIQYTQH